MSAEFPIPTGIPTSVTIPELRLLQRYAREAGTVLEIGTYYGFSAIGMALAGAHVTSVDPHRPDASAAMDTDSPVEDTFRPFIANLGRHGLWNPHERRVNVFRCGIEEVDWETLPWIGARFGMVFIDGDHMHPAPMRDARIALAHLRAPGYVAFHDVTPVWMDVWLTVRELERADELVKLDQERYLAVYQAAAFR